MKQIITTISIMMLLVAFFTPYLIGRCNYVTAGVTISHLMDDDQESGNDDKGWGTDADIQEILQLHYFEIDALAYPSFTDFYKSGLLTIDNIQNW